MIIITHAEVLIPPENQTEPLGTFAEFFCQVRGEILRVKVGELRYSLRLSSPNMLSPEITVNAVVTQMNMDFGEIQNITIRIRTTIELNNTIVQCIADKIEANATLIVQGTII